LLFKKFSPLFCLFFFAGKALCQNTLDVSLLENITLRSDSASYTLTPAKTTESNRLEFLYKRPNETFELLFKLQKTERIFTKINVLRSGDFDLIDSLVRLDDVHYRTKIRFKNLNDVKFPTLIIKFTEPDNDFVRLINLFPYTKTSVLPQLPDEEIFIGEEKVIELRGDNILNVEANDAWQSTPQFQYRFRVEDQILKLDVLPLQLGVHELRIPIRLKKPVLKGNIFNNELPPLRLKFTVKSGKLLFLNVDKKEISIEGGFGNAIEIQLDKNRQLQLKKTYRIENQLDPGGDLIGELFTRSLLANDKVLCWLRPYGFHRVSDGYLYIKDGDEAKFATNFNLLERTTINTVSILREGADWTQNLNLFPGERFELRLEGPGLNRGEITVEGLSELKLDSAVSSETQQIYKAKLSIDITKRKLPILINKKPSGFEFNVREYQIPRSFDYVLVDYGEGDKPLNSITSAVLYDKTIQNVIIKFDRERIDRGKIYGKQYLQLEVAVYNRRDMTEIKRVENIVIVPGETSPRFAFYDQKDAFKGEINLNNLLVHKTYDLPDWSRIEITLRQSSARYGEAAISQKIDIIQKRYFTFDIDVSFPAGLIIQKLGAAENQNTLGNLSGISTAVIAQFSFYRTDKVDRLKPYRIGAGFIALNAFNFNENNTNRDIGIVVLGSLFPPRTGNRFSFPLYGGFGYLIKDEKWFFVLGPGIQVRF
jgi:hypothetical protein